MRAWLEQHPAGRVFMAPLDATQFDVVEPDLLFVSRHRAADLLTAKHVTGAPDVVVEIGSSADAETRRDHQASPLRTIVSEMVVDLDLDVVRVYRNRDGRFDRPIELRADAGDVVRARIRRPEMRAEFSPSSAAGGDPGATPPACSTARRARHEAVSSCVSAAWQITLRSLDLQCPLPPAASTPGRSTPESSRARSPYPP